MLEIETPDEERTRESEPLRKARRRQPTYENEPLLLSETLREAQQRLRRLSEKEREALQTVTAHDTCAAAAAALGISVNAFKSRLNRARLRLRRLA